MGGGGAIVAYPLFQTEDGGAKPTSPLQLELGLIDKNLAKQCYRKWHYLGDTGFISTYDFGIFFGNYLYGCISYGSPNATELSGFFDRYSQEGWLEIKRLALSDDLMRNSESRVISISIKLLKKLQVVRGIVTYADSGVGHSGTIYKASGFEYIGLTKQKKDFYVNGVIQQRGKTKDKNGEWKERSIKHLYILEFRNGKRTKRTRRD